MGYQETYASNAADIYLKSAQQRANASRQRGVLIGNTLQALGQLPMEYQQQREHEQDRAAKQQQQQADNEIRRADLEIKRQQLAQKDDPTVAQKRALDLKLTQFEAAGRTLVDANAENWHVRRPVVLSILGPDAAADLPEAYPGDDVIQAHVKEGQSVEKQLEEKRKAIEDAKPKLATIETLNAAGERVKKFVEEKAGAEYQIPAVALTPDQIADNARADKQLEISRGQLAVSQQRASQATKAAGSQAADITKLTPAGLDIAALNYRKTGTMPPLGMGDRSTRQQIINRAAQLTPNDIAQIEAGGGDLAGNKAGYKADSASLGKLQQQADAVNAFENTAKKNIDLFLATAKKVTDTGIPLLNTPARWIAGAGGSADLAKYNAARQVAISEIAKIVQNPNLTGQLSDSARHEIEVFNPANATLKQTVAVMDLLKQDMANRKTSIDQQLKETRARIGGGKDTSGVDVQAPNGKTYHFSTRGDAEAFKARAGIK